MGRTAGQPARLATSDRSSVKANQARPPLAAVGPKAPTPPRAPASSSSPPPPPKAAAAECRTVREILPPWEVIQEKLQKSSKAPRSPSSPPSGGAIEVINQAAQEALRAQEAAAAGWGAPAEAVDMPPSGVRMSEPGQAAIATPPPSWRKPIAGAEPAVPNAVADPELSFKVYTVADLERRSDAPVSMRSSSGSRANFDLTSSRSAKNWPRVGAALKAFALASIEWFKIKGLRPSPKVHLRKPFDELGDELQVAVEGIDWKKLGVTTGIIVGATLTLLFAVLTAAELTDDLKPAGAASSHLATTETSGTGIPAKTAADARPVAPATNMAANGMQPVAAPAFSPNALAAPVVIAPSNDVGELDEPAPAHPAKKPAAKKPAASAAKKAPAKLTLRNAPF